MSSSLTSKPLISVLVRTKDRADMLEAALKSITEQTYRPLEVVLVNDGGADIYQQATTILSDIELIHLHNPCSQGRTIAANQALNHASGVACLFLDDDDLLDEHHIDSLATAHFDHFKADQLGITHTRARAISWSKNQSDQFLSLQGERCDRLKLLYQNCIPIMTALFTTAVRDFAQFDTEFDVFEDWDFWLQATQHCELYFVEQDSCTYRIHEQASDARQTITSQAAYQAIYKKWLPTLSDIEVAEIFRQSHLWHDQNIQSLQSLRNQELDRIGNLHQYALSVIEEKDQDILQLEASFNHAISTITEKDTDIEKLTSLHQQALDVIAKKDEDVAHLSTLHSQALDVIAQKDKDSSHLAGLYRDSVDYIATLEEALSKARSQAEASSNSYSELLEQVKRREHLIKTLERQTQQLESEKFQVNALLRKPWYWHLCRAVIRKKY